MSVKNLKGKISEFLKGIGSSIKEKAKDVLSGIKGKIESIGLTISIKYLKVASSYFKKMAIHRINLINRDLYDRPMLRDFPKYLGVGIYEGLGYLFDSVGNSLSNWRLDRKLAEILIPQQ